MDVTNFSMEQGKRFGAGDLSTYNITEPCSIEQYSPDANLIPPMLILGYSSMLQICFGGGSAQ